MQVEIDVADIEERTADGRGRITLGAEYADETVVVGIFKVRDA